MLIFKLQDDNTTHLAHGAKTVADALAQFAEVTGKDYSFGDDGFTVELVELNG